MTTARQAELARRRDYEGRVQMIATAADAIQDDATSTRYEAEAIAGRILDAILPQVSTVAELEALPYRSVLVATDGWVTRWMAGRDAEYILADAPTLPLTVVWQPEVTA